MLLFPQLLLTALSFLVLLSGLFLKEKKVLGYLSIAGLIASLLLVVSKFDVKESFPNFPFYNSIVVDSLAQFFNILFIIVSIIVCIASLKYYGANPDQGEYYFLLLLATVGMMTVAISNDLIALFIGIELASIPTYVLAAFDKDKRSIEAAMKYFIIGALSSAILLFGMSFIYGVTGSTNLKAISHSLTSSPLSFLGMMLIVAGFGFKMALVPFHIWAPDAYEGAPSVVSALLSSSSKKMGFIAAFRVFMFALLALKLECYLIFAILAVITMTFGNVVAIAQRSVKRMLAYSSIAHAGYIAIALAVFPFSPEAREMAIAGGELHILSHAFATSAAFICVQAVSHFGSSNKREGYSEDIESYSGLWRRAPATAFLFTLLLISLTGIPPTFGFYSKFVLFLSAIRGGLLWLAMIGVINSAISAYYYARVIRHMYWGAPVGGRVKEPPEYILPIAIGVAGILIFGLYPRPIYSWALKGAWMLLMIK